MLSVLVSNGGVEEPAVAVYLIGDALNRLSTDAEGAREYNEFVEVLAVQHPLYWFHPTMLFCRQSFK